MMLRRTVGGNVAVGSRTRHSVKIACVGWNEAQLTNTAVTAKRSPTRSSSSRIDPTFGLARYGVWSCHDSGWRIGRRPSRRNDYLFRAPLLALPRRRACRQPPRSLLGERRRAVAAMPVAAMVPSASSASVQAGSEGGAVPGGARVEAAVGRDLRGDRLPGVGGWSGRAGSSVCGALKPVRPSYRSRRPGATRSAAVAGWLPIRPIVLDVHLWRTPGPALTAISGW